VQERSRWWQSRWFIFPCVAYFLIAGTFLSFLTSIWGPSFWYFPCAILLGASGLLWLFGPRLGASFSLPLSLVFGIFVWTLRVWFWPSDRGTAIAIATAIFLAIFLCLFVITKGGFFPKAAIVSLFLVAIAFAVDRLFTNKLEIRTVSMQWTADGTTPWGEATQLDPNGRPPVLIYVRLGSSYCYDAVFHEPLKERLQQLGKKQIAVQYNVFKDFGSERAYNIRSIENVQLNDDHRSPAQDYGGHGGTLLGSVQDGQKFKSESPNCPR
jgi:hypothetical protein